MIDLSLLISQYQDSPNVKAFMETMAVSGHNELLKAIERLSTQLNLDTATGVWLDLLGERLGQERPKSFDDPLATSFNVLTWGSNDANKGWGGIWKPDDEYAQMSDNDYRTFLKAVIVRDYGTGTFADLVEWGELFSGIKPRVQEYETAVYLYSPNSINPIAKETLKRTSPVAEGVALTVYAGQEDKGIPTLTWGVEGKSWGQGHYPIRIL